jgi:hypothetical protein
VPALRLDTAAPLRRVVETPQGGLRVEAAVARAGVLRYRDTAGQEWAELVPAEELGAEPSLATLRGATVTDLHPEGLVTADTYRDVAVGHVHDDARVEGGYLVATLTVNDAAECARIRSGDRRDTSAGYVCDLDETPGVTAEGESYQRVQRNRRYNHVGLGPEGWGRAGSDVGLRLDGGAVAVRVDAPAGDPTMKKTIKLRGREVHLDMAEGEDKKLQMALDEDMGAVDEKIQKKDAEMGALGAQIDGLQTALTDALTQVATLGAAMKAMEAMKAEPAEPSEEVLDAALAVRETVRADAAKVLGAEVSLTGKKPAEIKRLVVAKVLPTVKLDSLSAEAIEGMYRGAVAAVSTVTRNDALGAANAAANGRDPQNPAAVKTDGDDDMGAKLRARTHAASRAPLTVNGKV